MYGIEFVTNPNSINDVISTTIVVNNQVDENASNPIQELQALKYNYQFFMAFFYQYSLSVSNDISLQIKSKDHYKPQFVDYA